MSFLIRILLLVCATAAGAQEPPIAVGAAVWQAPSPGEMCRDLMHQLAAADPPVGADDKLTARRLATDTDQPTGDV